jgi:hypothetical protein
VSFGLRAVGVATDRQRRGYGGWVVAADLITNAYQPTELIKEQDRLRHRECVFPHCHRPSRSCDLDHIIPWPLGPRASWNLAPLCRGHHRLKTHTDWTYPYVPGTGFVWTDPSGRRQIN